MNLERNLHHITRVKKKVTHLMIKLNRSVVLATRRSLVTDPTHPARSSSLVTNVSISFQRVESLGWRIRKLHHQQQLIRLRPAEIRKGADV